MSQTFRPAPTSEFVLAMGQHASSVCVITTVHDGVRHGLTATAVSSVCASPPRLLVCVNKSGLTHQMIRQAGSFCVNVLGEAHEQIAKAFAGMSGSDFDRFSLGDWKAMATGSPALAGATSIFDCAIAQEIDQFTHTIFIGEVVAAVSAPGQDALIYGARRFRTMRKTITAPQMESEEALHF